jgi:hypothetical protein
LDGDKCDVGNVPRRTENSRRILEFDPPPTGILLRRKKEEGRRKKEERRGKKEFLVLTNNQERLFNDRFFLTSAFPLPIPAKMQKAGWF